MREYVPMKQRLEEAQEKICKLEEVLRDLRAENEGLRFRCEIYERQLKAKRDGENRM